MLRTQRVWILGSMRAKVLESRWVRESAPDVGAGYHLKHISLGWAQTTLQPPREVWALARVTLNLQKADHLFWNFKMKKQEWVNRPEREGTCGSKLPQTLGIYDSFPFKMCRNRQEVHLSHPKQTGWNHTRRPVHSQGWYQAQKGQCREPLPEPISPQRVWLPDIAAAHKVHS